MQIFIKFQICYVLFQVFVSASKSIDVGAITGFGAAKNLWYIADNNTSARTQEMMLGKSMNVKEIYQQLL